MKKVKNIFVVSICLALLLTIAVLSGCSDNSLDERLVYNSEYVFADAEISLTNKQELPKWLVSIIDSLEDRCYTTEVSCKIYEASFENVEVYGIADYYNSVGPAFYNQNGDEINPTDIPGGYEFSNLRNRWKCIYIIANVDDGTDFIVTNGPHPGAKVERVTLASLPEWLAKLFENGQFSSFGITRGKVFRGEWNGKIVYHIYNPMSSCVYCEMFYEDGNAIVFDSEDIIRSFHETSKNWTFIYI